jgi:toxin CcdB
MRQFEVYPNPSPNSGSFAPYVVVLQSHYIDLKSVVVAPLVRDKLATSVEIAIEIEGEALVLALTELGSIWASSLRAPVADLTAKEYDIHRALDRLFKGF